MSWSGPNSNSNPFSRSGGPQQFWSWVHSLDPNAIGTGAGVDHSDHPAGPWGRGTPPGFPFHGAEVAFGGPGGWGSWGPHEGWGESRRGGHGRRGGRGRHGPQGRHESDEPADETMREAEEAEVSDKEKDDSPETLREGPEDSGPEHDPHGPSRRGRGRFGHRGDPWRHSRHHHHHHHHAGPHHGPHGSHGPGTRGPPPPFSPPPFGTAPPPTPPYSHAPFDVTNIMNQFAGHPLAQQLRDWATRFGGGLNNPNPSSNNNNNTREGCDSAGAGDDSCFMPPVDTFVTERSYVLHFALPGAKKEDIGVDWDTDKGELRVAGVVYRPGDEEFLATMASSERRVGVFSRSVALPSAGSDREEIDAVAIAAKIEDGVLIVTVPKLEKEWTEIHKVDIE
ncbi:Heat shock protein 16 [Colletotrichum sidae]|uniref:Heat shock protein 16 n=1 Tax=Colletotrichum sidae TaxID=1347389 RepID=A0A4R8T317_9PEZI|nr:Heat shock protein 16 [Colletotrichum sidae]